MCNPCYQAWYTANKRKPIWRKDPSEYAPNYRKPPSKVARNPECHPERKHVALGLCRACYQRDRPDRPRSECHPGRPAVANGQCGMCLSRTRYHDDPETARAQARDAGKRSRERLRDQMLDAYGGRCACANCPETNSAFLTLDHVERNGGEHRRRVGRGHVLADLRRQGWPQEGYRLLCWNCNALTRYGDLCPHEHSQGEMTKR